MKSPSGLDAEGERLRFLTRVVEREAALNIAEREGWVESATTWFELRRLRNQMVHAYTEDTRVFVDALNEAHTGVPLLQAAARAMRDELARRGWAS